MSATPPEASWASRGALKLLAALEAFGVSPAGAPAADLGASVGGFVDVLRRGGAEPVYALDTAYGQLAWTLRQDPGVVVMERTNALHAPPPPEAASACGVVSVDLGWTKQDRALPAALAWCRPGGHVVTLVKPHYESGRHRLDDGEAREIVDAVAASLPRIAAEAGAPAELVGCVESPIRGGKGKNLEALAVLRRLGPAEPAPR
ncbi:SAM-dependent methyltransferase [Phycisphaera mikurensis]|uniref:Putative hemolysin n=1 Tax=Phycisphaera mikurensis (strain NBRC 102666 / KCTC 22515 / FYK2301M01) TaxID=1142394 RepID=I0IAS3_PHYMF|nr:SAM-dependent methyltransferase [Phycisphaera mikurensis]MBB6442663.1 23S rRNA (cytidine1920-2'-O)/16S rRNA (cytidine1409-2'-O)-methyltransferase [Phycisphaera mikurensis]BAM02361.1 putative hemolysin [Phycisphaera mikurensis NBRC 102666]